VRIGLRIFEWFLRHPGVIRLAHVRRKTLDIKVSEFLITSLLGREHLHEHGGVNGRALHSLHA
jgi:hypothetical protein